ncbi:AraC family transcriptional regulator [Lacimicrobium alkaliphilum]|nr:AraC family transcriptional regulator [Lacimicrobium alkaliphilum]
MHASEKHFPIQAQQFLDSMPDRQWLKMYDLLTDVLVWVKDSQSRIMYANQAFLEHAGIDSLAQVVGLSDYDLTPGHIARLFVADDKRVMEGELITDRLEINRLPSGELHWFTTSKRPVYDYQERRVGTCGISRHLQKTSIMLSPLASIEKPMNFIKDNFTRDISITELAEHAHLSVSALERRFRKSLGKSPRQLINQLRLEYSRRLLIESKNPVYWVAEHCGFGDANYFSRQFMREFGESPSSFRQHFQN